ncbi:hypothetical protein SLL00_13720 [Metabacillus indicus]|uniref:hypothetical protein n=1 Tax=Metabacillus indicus TaxID=246786 RepID=UPI002A047737|nr:hypothetical protein [Metabacillus indicus]MDX8290865.1 hypothetical protein [Metabacillus indicus]
MKHIRPIAYRTRGELHQIYFLNTLEPKNEQLYTAEFKSGKLLLLCAYEHRYDRFSDVTSMFTEDYLFELSHFLKNFLPSRMARRSG